jgi:hypothetical protein
MKILFIILFAAMGLYILIRCCKIAKENRCPVCNRRLKSGQTLCDACMDEDKNGRTN